MARRLPNVALTGLARSGKDTAGRILVDDYGYRRVSFADGVRRVALAIDPIVGCDRDAVPYRLAEVVDVYGWEAAKRDPEIRRLLQMIGTEAGRDIFGHHLWTDLALDALRAYTGPLVFTDVRFPNEALAARKRGMLDGRGTLVVRMTRASAEALSGDCGAHSSETSVDSIHPDAVVCNDGTIGDLEAILHRLVGQEAS